MIAVRIRTFPDGVATAPADRSAAAIHPGVGPALAALTLAGNVITIVDRSVLESLAAGPGPMDDLRERLPPLVTVELDEDLIEESVLLDLADLLGLLPDVPGALVERNGRPHGVIARADVASALPLELLGVGADRLGNAPSLPSRRYVCRKCAPPSHRLPRSTTAGPPECSLVWFHGPMELEGG